MLVEAAKLTLQISNQKSLITESFLIYPMELLVYFVLCCNSLIKVFFFYWDCICFPLVFQKDVLRKKTKMQCVY